MLYIHALDLPFALSVYEADLTKAIGVIGIASTLGATLISLFENAIFLKPDNLFNIAYCMKERKRKGALAVN